MPLLIWSPSFKGNQKITSSTNHVDLPPTILGLAGLNDNLSEYIGENIFCKDNNSYSIIHTWGSAAIIKNHEWLKHSFKQSKKYGTGRKRLSIKNTSFILSGKL